MQQTEAQIANACKLRGNFLLSAYEYSQHQVFWIIAIQQRPSSSLAHTWRKHHDDAPAAARRVYCRNCALVQHLETLRTSNSRNSRESCLLMPDDMRTRVLNCVHACVCWVAHACALCVCVCVCALDAFDDVAHACRMKDAEALMCMQGLTSGSSNVARSAAIFPHSPQRSP